MQYPLNNAGMDRSCISCDTTSWTAASLPRYTKYQGSDEFRLASAWPTTSKQQQPTTNNQFWKDLSTTLLPSWTCNMGGSNSCNHRFWSINSAAARVDVAIFLRACCTKLAQQLEASHAAGSTKITLPLECWNRGSNQYSQNYTKLYSVIVNHCNLSIASWY